MAPSDVGAELGSGTSLPNPSKFSLFFSFASALALSRCSFELLFRSGRNNSGHGWRAGDPVIAADPDTFRRGVGCNGARRRWFCAGGRKRKSCLPVISSLEIRRTAANRAQDPTSMDLTGLEADHVLGLIIDEDPNLHRLAYDRPQQRKQRMIRFRFGRWNGLSWCGREGDKDWGKRWAT
jgi:hypothetical protein